MDKVENPEAGGADDEPDEDGGEVRSVAQLPQVLDAFVRGFATQGGFQKRTPSAPRNPGRPAPLEGTAREQKCRNCNGKYFRV